MQVSYKLHNVLQRSETVGSLLSSSSALTLLVGQQEGHMAQKIIGAGMLLLMI